MHLRPLANWLRYILSGALNFKQLVPDWSDRPLQCLEVLLQPLAPTLALHYAIVLRRIPLGLEYTGGRQP